MFGFNTYIMKKISGFNEFNSLRKNQLLAFYEDLRPVVSKRFTGTNKYRDYYFMPQFEIGQRELVDLHHYTYDIDIHAMLDKKYADKSLSKRINMVNQFLLRSINFSTQKVANYDKFMKPEELTRNKTYYPMLLDRFLSVEFFSKFGGLGNLAHTITLS